MTAKGQTFLRDSGITTQSVVRAESKLIPAIQETFMDQASEEDMMESMREWSHRCDRSADISNICSEVSVTNARTYEVCIRPELNPKVV